MPLRRVGALLLGTLAAVAWVGCAFFGYYGVQLVYHAITFRGEGSLGHVGMYIGAVLFPVLAVVCGALGWIGTRTARRWGRPPDSPRPERGATLDEEL